MLGNNFRKDLLQTIGKYFGENFIQHITKTNGSKLVNILRGIHLGNKSNKGMI